MWMGILIFYLIGCLINVGAIIFDHYKYRVEWNWLFWLDDIITIVGSWFIWIFLYFRDNLY